MKRPGSGTTRAPDRKGVTTDPASTPVQVASAVVGDAWSVLILREAMLLKTSRFVEFREALQVNRATLTDRLGRLVRAGLLERAAAAPGQERFAYLPTTRAWAYLPVLLAMLEWGRRWEVDPAEGDLIDVRHTACGARLSTVLSCRTCNGAIDARAVRAERPDRIVVRPASKSRHRAPQLDQLERGRPCPIARCLASIGDRWSVLIVQESFFGLREFDLLQRRLGIAPNILSQRLNRLCERGVLVRRSSRGTSRRQRYYLTHKGLDLYPFPALLRQWAVSTLGVEDPLHFSHRWCGAILAVDLRCVHCGASVTADTVHAELPDHLPANGTQAPA